MNKALDERMRVAISAERGVVREGQHEAGQAFTVRRVNAGQILLPSGRICIADAFSADEFPPLNRLFLVFAVFYVLSGSMWFIVNPSRRFYRELDVPSADPRGFPIHPYAARQEAANDSDGP